MFEDVTSRYDLSDATIEIVIMLLVAFLLGLLLGYLLSRRCCNKETNQDSDMNSSVGLAGMDVVDTSQAAQTTTPDGPEPNMLSAPNGKADDLKRISGVGPVLEKVLNDTGIYHYKQIAELTNDNIAWLDDKLAFPGRIERENWVGQAKALMSDVKTEFASRYDKEETNSNS